MSLAVVGVAGTVIGAGAGVYGAMQAGKGSGQSRSVNELGALPYEQQLEQARAYADAQFDLNRRQADLALSYGPQFAQQQRSQSQQLVKDLVQKLYPWAAGAERKQTSKQRTADLADFRRNAPGWSDAFGQASSAYGAIDDQVQAGPGTPLLDYLNTEALGAGPSALRTELQGQALGDLFLRGALSPEEERTAQQSARSAWSDRGLAYSNPAVGAEILQRDALARQREAERRQFAQAVWGIGANEDQLNRSFQTGVQGANEAATGNYRNFLISGSQAQLNPLLQASMQRSATQPMQLLGAYGAAPGGAGQAASVMTTAPSIAQGVQALTPLYSYGSDVANTNFNAAESRAINQANAYSAIGGGMMNLGGDLYGASLRGR